MNFVMPRNPFKILVECFTVVEVGGGTGPFGDCSIVVI